MASVGHETMQGWRHVLDLLRRWWIVLALGTVFALGIAATLVTGEPTAHRVEFIVLIDQPAVSLQPTVGKDSLEQIVELLPTIAQLAVRDDVLQSIAGELDLGMSPDSLRSHIDATPVPETLTLELAVEMEDGDTAEKVSAAILDRLGPQLGTLGSGAGAAQLSMEVLQRGDAKEVGQNTGRTLLLSALIGFGFALVAAAVLDRG